MTESRVLALKSINARPDSELASGANLKSYKIAHFVTPKRSSARFTLQSVALLVNSEMLSRFNCILSLAKSTKCCIISQFGNAIAIQLHIKLSEVDKVLHKVWIGPIKQIKTDEAVTKILIQMGLSKPVKVVAN